ncbi:unnamed protein product [marine sediment metagenome]|uniref:Uncharacterized protein n=1 Tax=marine sediment metagenome TaxID=412755 RepID=X0T0B0_9ZZZZ
MEWLQGKKTYLVVAAAVIAAIIGYLNGELTIVQGVGAILAALGLGSARSAIGKVGK